MKVLAPSALTVFLAVRVLAQNDGTYLLTSSNTVSPSSPTTTVEVWATWVDPNQDYIFGTGNYDLVADDGMFSNAVANPTLNISGHNTPGVSIGNRVAGAAIGQIHLVAGIIGNGDNPLWIASYDWTATDFAQRTVSLVTEATSTYVVLSLASGVSTQLFPAQFNPGSGIIHVVPAPGALATLVLLVAATPKNRRSGIE